MAKVTSSNRGQISSAVVSLRSALGESQQAFSNRLGMALNTVSRYESVKPPAGLMLLKLATIAAQNGLRELSEIFRNAFQLEAEAEGIEFEVSELNNTLIRARISQNNRKIAENERKIDENKRKLAEYETGISQLQVQAQPVIHSFREIMNGIREVRQSLSPLDSQIGQGFFATEEEIVRADQLIYEIDQIETPNPLERMTKLMPLLNEMWALIAHWQFTIKDSVLTDAKPSDKAAVELE